VVKVEKNCEKIKVELTLFKEVNTLEEAEEISMLIYETWKRYQRPHSPEDILDNQIRWYIASYNKKVVGAGFHT